MSINDVDTRTQAEMERIAQDNLATTGPYFLYCHRLDRSRRADGHKRGCLNFSTDQFHPAAPRRIVLSFDVKLQTHSVTFSSHMASP